MPIFSAQCLENHIDAESNGTIRINGAPMDVEEVNSNFYQAPMESLTISISHERGGRNLIVNFTGSGGSNGRCKIPIASVEGSGANDGGGAMAGAPSPGEQRVHFAAGTSPADLRGNLTPGTAAHYVLGARKNQFLDVYVDFQGGGLMDYQIYNPDGSSLERVEDGATYRGQLWQSGDHVIELIGRGGGSVSCTATMGIN